MISLMHGVKCTSKPMCSAPEVLFCLTRLVVKSILEDGPWNRHSDFAYIRPMVHLELTVPTIGKKTSRSSVFRSVNTIGFFYKKKKTIINLSDSEDDGILLPGCCRMDPFSSLEVKLEAMLVLSQVWKYFQSLPAVTLWFPLIGLLELTPSICILSLLSFQAHISSLVRSRLFSFDRTFVSFHFQGYYNEARILDPVTFNTITQLPNIPGAVNNCAYFIILSLIKL